MLPSLEALQNCLHLLSQNQVIVLPLNGIYYLASLPSAANFQNLTKITQNATPVEYLFASFTELQNHTDQIPAWSSFLLKEILPNHLTCILPARNDLENDLGSNKQTVFQKKNIYCNQTSHPYIQNLLDNLDTPLIVVKAVLAGYPPATNLAMLKDYFDESLNSFFPTKYIITGISPTVIDLTDSDKLVIKEPGILDRNDFKSIVPQQIKIEEKFEHSTSFNIYHNHSSNLATLVDDYNSKEQNNSVIIGTKEKLRQVFDFSVIDSFFDYHNKIHKGQVLLNLGSQTNLENVAKHLSQKIHEASYFRMSKVVVLDQNWGNSKWGKIIKFSLSKYTQKDLLVKTPEEDKEDRKIIQNSPKILDKINIFKNIHNFFQPLIIFFSSKIKRKMYKKA